METVLTPMQLLPGLGLPGVLSTVVIVILVLLVARFLLNVAFKIAVLAAVVIGVLWLFGAVSVLPF